METQQEIMEYLSLFEKSHRAVSAISGIDSAVVAPIAASFVNNVLTESGKNRRVASMSQRENGAWQPRANGASNSEQASERQRAYLRDLLGVEPAKGLTRAEASKQIEEALSDVEED